MDLAEAISGDEEGEEVQKSIGDEEEEAQSSIVSGEEELHKVGEDHGGGEPQEENEEEDQGNQKDEEDDEHQIEAGEEPQKEADEEPQKDGDDEEHSRQSVGDEEEEQQKEVNDEESHNQLSDGENKKNEDPQKDVEEESLRQSIDGNEEEPQQEANGEESQKSVDGEDEEEQPKEREDEEHQKEGEDEEPQNESDLVEEQSLSGDEHKDGDVTTLMQNIFGDDMSDDDDEKANEGGEGSSGAKGFGSDDEPKLLRVEQDEDEDEDTHGRRWDFDVMLDKKKLDRRRRRRRDGSIDLMADADDQIRELIDAMNEAANDDRNANIDRRPAVKKRKMLSLVKNALVKVDLFEAMLENGFEFLFIYFITLMKIGMVSAISEWLAPLPDKSLPALEIRCTFLKILERWPNLEQGILKQSGLGKAVMYLYKHPKETKENKLIAAKLIREWSRPIFQLDSDFRSLSKEERVQRDYSQMPLAKRKRLSVDEDNNSGQIFSSTKKSQKEKDGPKRPGDPGFIPRARVPKLSTKDYVVRPKPEIESQFRGETKNKQASRFVRAQRGFRQTNKTGLVKRAVGVSISGKNL
uniref:TFIIS N-terminal domain-containing protein n=1 Tax=Meloidogyne hapla TaxID=6305 RepID=A0A1I8BCZ6_MELHA